MAGTGLTLVLVTHDSALASRAQRGAVMSKGRLAVRAGPAAQPPVS